MPPELGQDDAETRAHLSDRTPIFKLAEGLARFGLERKISRHVPLQMDQEATVAKSFCPPRRLLDGARQLQQAVHPFPTFRQQRPRLPERDQGGGQPDAPRKLLLFNQPLVRCAIIGVLHVAATHPLGLFPATQAIAFFGEYHAIRGMRAASQLAVVAGSQPLLRIFSNRFQLADTVWIAVIHDNEHVLLDEAVQQILHTSPQIGEDVAHCLNPLRCAPTGKDSHATKEHPLGGIEQFLAPFEGGAK